MISSRANVALWAAFFIEIPATAWGTAAVYSILFPGPDGEWTALYELLSYGICLPAGAVAAALTWIGRDGNRRLRAVNIALAFIVLLLPLLGTILLKAHQP